MTQKILRYELELGQTTMRVPADAVPVYCDARGQTLQIWVKGNPDYLVDTKILVLPTGAAWPDHWDYCGSVQIHVQGTQYLVWHIFWPIAGATP